MSEIKVDGISDSIRDQIITFIREDSKNGSLTPDKKILTNYSDCPELSGFSREFTDSQEFSDIKEICGNAGLYFYSTKYMTDRYARLAVMLAEKDLLKIVVSTIRDDCRIYPRPTALDLFKEPPYNISVDNLQALLQIIKNDEEYNDIAFCKTSVDTVYLYSTEYMQSGQAEYISEWDAVGQYESQ